MENIIFKTLKISHHFKRGFKYFKFGDICSFFIENLQVMSYMSNWKDTLSSNILHH